MSLSRIERTQIQSYLKDFLKKRIANFKIGKKIFTCPRCGEQSCNIFPEGSNKVFCFGKCKKLGDIIDLSRLIDWEGNSDVSDEEIAKELKKEFKIQTNDETEKLLAFYASLNWDLVPVSKNSKASDIEKEWQKKSHKDLNEWRQWVSSGLNIGIKTGQMSNTVGVDFDLVDSKLKKKIYEGKGTEKDFEEAKTQHEDGLKLIKEKLSFLDFETLTQITFGGIHLFFSYDTEINNQAFDFEGIHVDIKSTNGQIVIAPSVVGSQTRKIIGEEIKPISKELKEWILSQNKKEEITPLNNEESDLVSYDEERITGLNGNCNNTFVKVGGILRTFLSAKEVEKALTIINQEMLEDPMDRKSILSMCEQLKKYDKIDESALFKKIWNYFLKHEEASPRDLKECLEAKPNEIKEILSHLVKENKLYKQRNLYKLIAKADWKTAFVEESKILQYQVPYLNDYAVCRRGDMICVGSKSGWGKSHLAMNIIKKFSENRIQPEGGIRYLSSEPGNRFATIAMKLGLKEGDFYFCNHYAPEKIELEDNAVTIIDWLLPNDFSQTANLYKIFAQQLDKHGGLCFIFSQLKDDGKFYAEEMVKFFASVACKYLHTVKDKQVDNKNTYIQTEKIREAKCGKQFLTIPTRFTDEGFVEIRK